MPRRSGQPAADSETFDLSASVGHLLRRAQQRGAAIYATEIGRDLSSRQFSVLISVSQNPGLAQIDLVQRIGIDRSTLSALVDRLVKRDMLTRERIVTDQRADVLLITPKGQAAVRKRIPGAHEVNRQIMQMLPADLRPAFVTALTILAEQRDDDEASTLKKKPARKTGPAQKLK
jgi:DNA-binding MarR family transcriptional regulator